MTEYRYAIVKADTPERVAAYLPASYEVSDSWRAWPDTDNWEVLITGHDVAGWTLDGYVLPRLASGLIFGREVSWHEVHASVEAREQHWDERS